MSLKDPRLLFHLILSEDLPGLFGPGPLHTDNWPRLEFEAPRLLYQYDASIEKKITQGRILSKRTKEIVEATSPANSLIDLVAFSASVFSPLFRIVDPDDVTPAQKVRYGKILEDYCNGTLVEDYQIFPGRWQREKCAGIQAAKIRKHLAISPKDAAAHYSLGHALREMGETDSAIKSFEKSASLNPFNAKAFNNMGALHMRKDDLDKAETAFRKAISLNPGHARAYFNLAMIAYGRGEKGAAVRYLQEGLKHEANSRAKELLEKIQSADD